MKIIYISLTALFLGLFTTSCNNFLDQGPLTNPPAKGFFSSRTQVEEYTNRLYTSIPSFQTYGMGPLGVDKNSDNIISENYDRRLNGEYTINSGESEWTTAYQRLRDVNYLLTFYDVPKDRESDETRSLLGEAHFMRAYWHFNLLKNFGSAPIMNEVWDDNATIDGLQKDPATRGELAKFILKDLDDAISMLLPRDRYKGLRINKEAAMVFAMNVALYEGSWEYYHRNDAFAAPVDEHQLFLNKVLELGDKLMAMGITLNTKPADNSAKSFAELFNSQDLSNIPEVLLWRKYSNDEGIFHNIGGLLKAGVVDESGPAGVTKGFVDTYLMADGSVTDISNPSYKDFINTFQGRDPRLLRTIMNQGADWASPKNGNSKPMFLAEYSEALKDKISAPRINGDGQGRSLTGYHIRLCIDDQYVTGPSTTAYPVIRYAEALLDYAEAAEILGGASDEVLDKTIKPLRERAGVRYVKPSGVDNFFPDYGYPLTPNMREIRRERRVELGLQGFRFDDLMRWKGDKLIVGKRGKGAYLGDDAILFKSFDEDNRAQIKAKVILDENKYLDPMAKKLSNGYQFNPERDYLLPIPATEISLEKKLKQNPGW